MVCALIVKQILLLRQQEANIRVALIINRTKLVKGKPKESSWDIASVLRKGEDGVLLPIVNDVFFSMSVSLD